MESGSHSYGQIAIILGGVGVVALPAAFAEAEIIF